MENETTLLLEEITREVDTLLTKHRTASNEIAAAIAREAYLDAVSFAGIDARRADAHFALHFPTLRFYL